MSHKHDIWPSQVKTKFADSNIVVLKFGGTSVADLQSWEKIYTITKERLDAGLLPFIVNSAISGASNQLAGIIQNITSPNIEKKLIAFKEVHINLCQDLLLEDSIIENEYVNLHNLVDSCHIIGSITIPEQARIMASGELLATTIGQAYLQKKGLAIEIIDSRDYLRSITHTNARDFANYLAVEANYNYNEELLTRINASNKCFIASGFIAQNDSGETVLLGRGGSDTSASYYAAMMNALRLEVWTDVRGFYDADPRVIPDVHNINHLSYEEAQEISSAGGSVLHPKTIPPLKAKDIPIFVLSSKTNDLMGTVIDSSKINIKPEIIAIAKKSNVTVVSVTNSSMWQESGYLAEIFDIFKHYNVSIDLVSTSETNISVSIDTISNNIFLNEFEGFRSKLMTYGDVEIFHDCTSVSLIGYKIKNIIQHISSALSFFEDNEIYLFTHSASGLNFSFVIDSEVSSKIFKNIYDDLFKSVRQSPQIEGDLDISYTQDQWWFRKSNEILPLLDAETSAYVYDIDTVIERYTQLKELSCFNKVLYAMKANDNPAILKNLETIGASFECVSKQEIEYLLNLLPALNLDKILFTPNFVSYDELEWSLNKGIMTTIDNEYIFDNWAPLLSGKKIFIRIDTGYGQGHHAHVKTAGDNSKFGIPLANIRRIFDLANKNNVDIVGLHAHSGSGITRIENWIDMLKILLSITSQLRNLRYIDIGGGLNVTDIIHQETINFDTLSKELNNLMSHYSYELWAEPGRYIVANSGVLVSKVNQIKAKGNINYLGIDTGMNSLIRPSLYGSYHQIVNLTRLGEEPCRMYTLVGPICESGDRLARDRWLPETKEGDVILIANAGAYGKVMSSNYNMRPSASEKIL